jgi:hypothetical protein
MGTRKYRTVVAAILIGAVLFSPLLCGMTCLERGGIRLSVGEEIAPPAPVAELVAKFAESAVVGCLLTHVALDIDLSDWTDRMDFGTLVWVGEVVWM